MVYSVYIAQLQLILNKHGYNECIKFKSSICTMINVHISDHTQGLDEQELSIETRSDGSGRRLRFGTLPANFAL